MRRFDTTLFCSPVLKGKTEPISAEREKELSLIIQREVQTITALKKLVRRSRNKLSEEEKNQLVDFIGKNPAVQDAVIELVMANSGFAISVAMEYLHRGIPADELNSLALEGLTIATFHYKTGMGTKFTSYAIWWVRQVILEALEYHKKIVRPPLQKIGDLTNLARCDEQLTQVLGRYPTQREVTDELGISDWQYADLRAIQQGHYSLDTPIDRDKGEDCWRDLIMDKGPRPDERLEEKEAIGLLNKLLGDFLTERECEVLRLYFGLGDIEDLTLEEIGDQMGLTRERIRQITKGALKKLRIVLGYRRYREYRRALRDVFPQIKSLEVV